MDLEKKNNATAQLINYVLHLADTNLILAQRNAALCAHGPILEQDIAISNITLDILGQARYFYKYAATLINENGFENFELPVSEDSLAYLRTERDFKNLLITELPNTDWAHTIFRQMVFSKFAQLLYIGLLQHPHQQIAAIAEKSLKEINYHVKWSSEWVIRLGDGTEESRNRMLQAIENFWPYCGEFFMPADFETEEITTVNLAALKPVWLQYISEILTEATLTVPAFDKDEKGNSVFMQSGGKQGVHTEYMGFLLTDLQYLQRTYPNAEW